MSVKDYMTFAACRSSMPAHLGDMLYRTKLEKHPETESACKPTPSLILTEA